MTNNIYMLFPKSNTISMKNVPFNFMLVLFCVISLNSNAQQDAQYTQYMYNTISVNPAYAGSRGVMSIMGLHRSQWVGLEGAPRKYSNRR